MNKKEKKKGKEKNENGLFSSCKNIRST